MSEKVSIEVTLDGKEYSITGSESKEYMAKVADYINLKAQLLNGEEKFRELPNRLREYMMNFDIANDYMKAVDEISNLNDIINKKDEEIYALKHELARTQTDLSREKKHRVFDIPVYDKRSEEAERVAESSGDNQENIHE